MLKMYVLFDSLAEKFGFPFMQENDACAVREVKKMFKNDESSLSDYKLFYVGSFNNESPIDLNPVCLVDSMLEVELFLEV